MTYEVTFNIRDTKQIGSVTLTTPPAPPAQAIKACLKNLKAVGYPMRNTVTELIRELLYLKLELGLKGNENAASELRSTDTRRSAASVGAGKA